MTQDKEKMRCPYCKKEIDLEDLSKVRKERILNEIKKEVHSITSLSKKVDMKRSTLIYYLDQLENEKKIIEERLENLQGRPTILKAK